MGLAGVKKSTRIGLDPRNTKWINNENGIGHKLLAAQGWTPGQGLGDTMKGRTVNIKQTYKEDTAGIGCTAQHAQEWSGLGAFNDIFTRINNGESVPDVSDPGLRNKERVLYIDTNQKRVGLDVRFVKGETFTSDLSKAKFLESLGIGVTTLSEKEQKKLRKREKLARKEARTAKRAEKASRKKHKSQVSTRAASSDSSKSKGETEATSEVVKAVVIPGPSKQHGRFASRAKYQRAKLGGRMDAAQLAQILGVKA